MEQIEYNWLTGHLAQANSGLLAEFSELYSNHYGTWSQSVPKQEGKGPEAGGKIRLSPLRIRQWLEDPDSLVYYAKCNGNCIGYAIAIRKRVKDYGVVSWVTQLVVRKDFRNQGIAKRLLFSFWGLSDDFAWGILSANPYAVRALEKATRRRSVPMRIRKHIGKLMEIGADALPYLSHDTEYLVDANHSSVNTEFFVDHAEIPDMLRRAVTESAPWLLGDLPEGWEWVAFTFRDQEQIKLSKPEIEKMITASDEIAKQAYSRMQMDKHPWAKHTDKECRFILRECGLKAGMSAIDFGCGIGRHANALAARGIRVVGVDYVESHIDAAREKSHGNANVRFLTGDCRTADLTADGLYDAAICVYDVIGSYAKRESNQMILDNIAKHLKKGGIAALSVMNYELTLAKATHKFIFRQEPDKLLSLNPSATMEESGDIFQPDYLMIDEETHIVYRREQFKRGTEIPVELVVQDRRFSMSEIKAMCEKAGLKVLLSRYVNASDWDLPLEATDERAKEILLKCEKI